MARMYRGITGVVRRAINNGTIKGKIFIADVQQLMPEGKKDVPENVVRSSLNRMARNKEIHRVHKEFYTKDMKLSTIQKAVEVVSTTEPAPKRRKPEAKNVSVTGRLVGTTMQDGKMIASIEVSNLNFD